MGDAGIAVRRGTPPRPRYRFPIWFVLDWLLTAPGATRDLARDAARALRGYPPPSVDGLEHVPRGTPFILVANHYSREGLGVWWTALALTRSVAAPTSAPLRWLSIDRLEAFRIARIVPVPSSVSAAVIRFVAARYRMLLVSRVNVQQRSPMLRDARRALHQEGHSVALFPEGIRSFAGGVLAEAFDGSGHVLAWLSDGRFPILPAGVYEDASGALRIQFGAPLVLDRRSVRGTNVTASVMERIAVMLPDHLRGAYAPLDQ